MTTSNQTIYELTRDNIIAAAMRKIGALALGQTPTAEDLTNGQQALNALVSEFQTMGMPLWKRVQYSLSTVINTNSYTFGVGQTVNTPFPLKIDSVILRLTGGSAQDIIPCSRTDFNLLNSSSTGKPVQYTYQPFVNSGTLILWPKPDAVYTIELTYREGIDGFTAAGETPDFPQEWQNALIYGLAELLSPEYGVPLNDRSTLRKEAERHLDIAQNFNYENVSVFFGVDRRY